MLSTVTDHPTDRVDDGDAAAAADGGGGDEGDVCHPLQSRLWSYLSIIILRPIESHFPKSLHIISILISFCPYQSSFSTLWQQLRFGASLNEHIIYDLCLWNHFHLSSLPLSLSQLKDQSSWDCLPQKTRFPRLITERHSIWLLVPEFSPTLLILNSDSWI